MGIIRLLLAIAVFNSHYPFLEMSVVDGHEAVLAFFAISGFYIAMILDTAYGSKRTFYLSRFLTLYPIYALGIAVSVGLLATLNVHPMTGMAELDTVFSDPVGFIALVGTAIFPIGQELLFSLALTPDGMHTVTASRDAIWVHAPLIQAWSLSLEIYFYALAPMLVTLRNRTLVTLAALSLVGKFAVMVTGLDEIAFYKRFFPIEFWLFVCGILAYRFYKQLDKKPRLLDYAAFGILVATVLSVDIVPDYAEPFAMPVATLICMPFVFRGFAKLSLDRHMGRISYPFYLFHFSAIAIFETYMDEPSGWLILAATLPIAILTHNIFTPGLDRLKATMKRPEPQAMPSPLPVKQKS